ncbi:MAG: hypothetical protein WAW02_11525 [Sideroxyarcus sp.]
MKKQWHIYLAGGLFATSLGLHAEAWNCQNSVEIQCTDAACTTSEHGEVTPADVSFDTRGTFSICVYSGCWNGKGHVVTNGPLLVIQKNRADWSVPNLKAEMREDVSIVFSTKDHIALVKTGTLILPMHCSKPPQ